MHHHHKHLANDACRYPTTPLMHITCRWSQVDPQASKSLALFQWHKSRSMPHPQLPQSHLCASHSPHRKAHVQAKPAARLYITRLGGAGVAEDPSGIMPASKSPRPVSTSMLLTYKPGVSTLRRNRSQAGLAAQPAAPMMAFTDPRWLGLWEKGLRQTPSGAEEAKQQHRVFTRVLVVHASLISAGVLPATNNIAKA